MDSDDSDYPSRYSGYRSDSVDRDTSGAAHSNPATANSSTNARNAAEQRDANNESNAAATPSNGDSTNVTATTTNVPTSGVESNLTTREFQTFIIDQLVKIQEQNEILKQKVETLEQEQEAYYLNNAKRLESGFRDITKS
ncbi:similar to Saccharomyces cerevisiae YMR111C Protein of unknown function (Partial), partial [Maudiozyma saulgeensis]